MTTTLPNKLKAVPATVLADFYKITHRMFYPEGTTKVYSTWIPRSSEHFQVPSDYAIAFGYQQLIEKDLIQYFNENFFNRALNEVISEYKYVIENTLGGDADVSHIKALHKLGYLPIEIKAVPEGMRVPIKVPALTIENTLPEFYWLTNYLETLMSSELWMASNSATIASHYRDLLNYHAMKTVGSTDGVEFQGHDFSLRGMSGIQAGISSGMGHLLSFLGTDNIPAIVAVEMYYNEKLSETLIGTSVPATEHSIMSSFGRDEKRAFGTIIDTVPTGIVSIVSDTYNFWNVLLTVIPSLKEKIMARDGKVVLRPDSGDPIDILCGTNPNADQSSTPEEKGAVQMLWEIFGGTTTERGFKLLDSHIGLLYGDAITLERAEKISNKLADKGFASTNVVFGIGSYTYQYNTRDTLGYALKATYTEVNGVGRFIEKDPATDKNNLKKSLTGKVAVVKRDGKWVGIDHLTSEDEKNVEDNILQTIFKDGKAYNKQTFTEVKNRVNGILQSPRGV